MKQHFKKGANQNQLNYPMTKAGLREIQDSHLVNPCVGKRHGLNDFEFDKIEVYTNEILHARLEVKKGIYPKWFMDIYYPFEAGISPSAMPGPLVAEGLSFDAPKSLAQVVHMDSPTDAPKACLRWLLNKGAKIKDAPTNYIDFLGAIPTVEENIADGVKKALYKGFEAKYFFGVARPEEIFELRTAIPPQLFTAYPEGCPNHPSYPAGHGSAVAGGVRRLIEHFELTKEELTEILDTAYLWAMFRSLAGVHYAVDNVTGLVMGGLDKHFTNEAKEQYLAK